MPRYVSRLDHGHASRKAKKSRTYRAWESMRARCNYVRGKDYHNYGGRGIRVCERWNSFANFLADMGECPDGMSLEREDNNGNYEPGNCVWATHKAQCDNRRTCVMVEYQGRTQTIKRWCAELGLDYVRTYARIREHAWSVERAFTTPVMTTWSRRKPR